MDVQNKGRLAAVTVFTLLFSAGAFAGDSVEAKIKRAKSAAPPAVRPAPGPWSGRFRDRAIVTDLDKSLLSDRQSLQEFVKVIRERRKQATFGIAVQRGSEVKSG